MSQQALANEIGASRHWIMDLERGKPTLEVGLILRAIVALGLSVDLRDRASTQPLNRRVWQGGLEGPGDVPGMAAWSSRGASSRAARVREAAGAGAVPDLGDVLEKARGLDLGMRRTGSGGKAGEKL